MPNITIYTGNSLYIKFLQLQDDKRKEIRNKVKALIEEELRGE